MTRTRSTRSDRSSRLGAATRLLAAATVLTTALTACGNSRGNTSTPQTDCDLSAYRSASIDWKQLSGQSVAVSVEQHPWWATVEPQLKCFEELTGMSVKPTVLGEEQYVSKVAVELSSGSKTPDVFMVNQYGQAVGSKWLEPLNQYLENTKLTDAAWYDKDDFFPGASDYAKTNGEFMAMPITAEAQMLFVRKDLVPNAPTTIEQLLAAAKAANKDGVAGFGSRSIAAASETPWAFGGFAFSNGGAFLDGDGKPVLNSAANVAALKTYAELIGKSGSKGAAGWGYQENQQAMQQGKLAMWTDSSTFLGGLKDKTTSRNGEQIDAYPFPAGAGGKSVPDAWYWTVGINSRSEHKDAAWLFLQWATSLPISEAGAAKGASPAREKAWQSKDVAATIGPENAERVRLALEKVDSKPLSDAWKSTKWNQIADPLARAVNAAVSGGDAQQALDGAQAAAEKVVSK